MVSRSNSDRFDNDKTFFETDNDDIWDFLIIIAIYYVSNFFVFILKTH